MEGERRVAGVEAKTPLTESSSRLDDALSPQVLRIIKSSRCVQRGQRFISCSFNSSEPLQQQPHLSNHTGLQRPASPTSHCIPSVRNSGPYFLAPLLFFFWVFNQVARNSRFHLLPA